MLQGLDAGFDGSCVDRLFFLLRPGPPIGVSGTISRRSVQFGGWVTLLPHGRVDIKGLGIVKGSIELMVENLARSHDLVVRRTQGLHDGGTVGKGCFPITSIAINARCGGSQTCQGRHARWVACRRHAIGSCECHASCRKLVQVRRSRGGLGIQQRNPIVQVIHNDHQDVGTIDALCQRARGQKEQASQKMGDGVSWMDQHS